MSKKTSSVLYFLASAALYAVAIIKMFTVDFSSGIIWLCLGSAFLCLGAAMLNQSKNEADKTEEKTTDSVLTDEKKAEIQKQNDDFTTIDTMM